MPAECSHNFIDQAHAHCQKAALKLTPVREKVLSILVAQSHPQTAYEILAHYQQTQQSGAQPMTIYRALSFLESAGLVHRLASTSQYVVCDHMGKPHHGAAQFFMCDACGRIQEWVMADAMWASIVAQAAELSFKVVQPGIEIHGLCQHCQPHQAD